MNILKENIASVGYYIGVMKDKDLKISEGKKIIIATYARAEEALDIKSLTSLMLAIVEAIFGAAILFDRLRKIRALLRSSSKKVPLQKLKQPLTRTGMLSFTA